PIELLWQGEFESRVAALEFERQVKGWSRAKKEALMAGDWERVQALSRSGSRHAESSAAGAPTHSVRPEPTHTVRPEPTHTVRPEPTHTVRPEPVEGLARLRQAQPERGGGVVDGER